MFDRVAVHREAAVHSVHPDYFKCYVYKGSAWASTWVHDVLLQDDLLSRAGVFKLLERDLANELTKHDQEVT